MIRATIVEARDDKNIGIGGCHAAAPSGWNSDGPLVTGEVDLYSIK
jgi:hypothetical protein